MRATPGIRILRLSASIGEGRLVLGSRVAVVACLSLPLRTGKPLHDGTGLSHLVLSRSGVEVVGRFRNPWVSGALGVVAVLSAPVAHKRNRLLRFSCLGAKGKSGQRARRTPVVRSQAGTKSAVPLACARRGNGLMKRFELCRECRTIDWRSQATAFEDPA